MKIFDKFTVAARLLIGGMLLIFALYQIVWDQLEITLRDASLFLILLAFLASGLLLALKTYRWKLLLRCYGINLGYFTLMDCSTRTNIYGSLTPGRIGELTKVHILGRQGVGPAIVIKTILYDRICDVLPLVILSALMLARLTAVNILLAAILIGTSLIVMVGLLFHLFGGRDGGSRIIEGIFVFALCVFVYILFNYLIMKSLGMRLDMPASAGLAAVIGLVSALPISIAGIGTRDVVLLGLAGKLQVTSSIMFSLSVLELIFATIVPFLHRYMFLAMAWALQPRKKEHQSSG